MAYFSYSYTLTNGTTADASQVMQNFNDALNGISDGTKDLNVAALTTAGNTTLGDSSADDLILNASLASSIAIKTTNSYDIGANALALRALYLASNDGAGRATKLIGGVVGSNYTFTLPTGIGTNRHRLMSTGSVTQFNEVRNPDELSNYSIAASKNANALTISVKGADGNALSATNVMDIGFRHATSATGTPAFIAATSISDLVIESGSDLGMAGGSKDEYVYVYLLNNAGTPELAVSRTVFDDGSVKTSVDINSPAGGADTATALYSDSARTGVAIRLIGRLKFSLATAGAWDEVPDEISLPPFRSVAVSAFYKYAGGDTAANGSATVINYATKVFDTHSAVTTGAGTWKFTAPVPGKYLVSGNSLSDSSAGWESGEVWALALYKNGSIDRYLGQNYAAFTFGAPQAPMSAGGTGVIDLNGGDYIDLRVLQTSDAGVALDTDGNINWVSIVRVGDL